MEFGQADKRYHTCWLSISPRGIRCFVVNMFIILNDLEALQCASFHCYGQKTCAASSRINLHRGMWLRLCCVIWCAKSNINSAQQSEVTLSLSDMCSYKNHTAQSLSFLAATKQLYKWYFPSVCPSVRHTFLTMFPSSYHHETFRSYYQWPT